MGKRNISEIYSKTINAENVDVVHELILSDWVLNV